VAEWLKKQTFYESPVGSGMAFGKKCSMFQQKSIIIGGHWAFSNTRYECFFVMYSNDMAKSQQSTILVVESQIVNSKSKCKHSVGYFHYFGNHYVG